MQPKTQQAWETIAGGPDLHEGGLGFTCYTPVKSGEGSFEVADHDTSALVSFLFRNHVFSGSPAQQDPFVGEPGDMLYPTSSSTHSAATLGFFAFKELKMDMLEFSCEGVINHSPPILHPMGYFWMLKGKDLVDRIRNGSVKLRRAAFEMVIVSTGAAKKHSEVLLGVQRAHLLERKRLLQDQVENSRKQLRRDQDALAAVDEDLKKLKQPAINV